MDAFQRAAWDALLLAAFWPHVGPACPLCGSTDRTSLKDCPRWRPRS